MAVIVRIKQMLAAAGLAVMVSGVAAAPASAASEPAPRAGEWWLTTWKMLPIVWPLTQGAGVTVAVLDTGVQASAPDLRGAVLPGGDVTGRRTNGETDFNTSGHGHGTTMAVLIAGRGFGTGMIGMAPQAKILPVVVNAATANTSDPGAIAAGITYAVNHGARVIDISQEHPAAAASGCDAAEQSAVAYALAHDVVVVAAAGDTNLIGAAPAEPASCIGVLAVGAVQANRVPWPKDARQPYLTVVNPGAALISSGRDGQLVTGVSGTRAASALAAGAVALIRSRYPAMPWYRVIQRVTGTVLPDGGQVPNDSFGYGIFRLSHAINATAYPVPANAPNPVYARYQAWLATPQGRLISRQFAAAAAGTGKAAGTGMSGSAFPALIAVTALLAAVGAGAGVQFARAKRRPLTRSQGRHRPRKEPPGAAFPDLAGAQEEYLSSSAAAHSDAPAGYVVLGADTSYRIPPYIRRLLVEDLQHVAGVQEDDVAHRGFRAGEQASVHRALGAGRPRGDERHRDPVVVADLPDHADRAQAHRQTPAFSSARRRPVTASTAAATSGDRPAPISNAAPSIP